MAPLPSPLPRVRTAFQTACHWARGRGKIRNEAQNPGRRSRVTAVTRSLCPGLFSVALTGQRAATRAVLQRPLCPARDVERAQLPRWRRKRIALLITSMKREGFQVSGPFDSMYRFFATCKAFSGNFQVSLLYLFLIV